MQQSIHLAGILSCEICEICGSISSSHQPADESRNQRGGSSVTSSFTSSPPRLTTTGTLSPALYLRRALSKSSRLPILLSPN